MRDRARAQSLLGAAAAVASVLSPFASAGALAAESKSTLTRHSLRTDAQRVRELERRLDERDAVIHDLELRVERLEQERAAGVTRAAAPRRAAVGPAKAAAPGQANGGSSTVAQGPGPPAAQTAPKAGPGEFAVSKEAAERALERALVQSGAALLPRGKFEFVPSAFYQYQRNATPAQIALTSTGNVLITENVARLTQVQATALLRMGLPFDSQAEIGLPFDYKRTSIATRANGAGLSQTAASSDGLGDFSVALTKQILADSDGRPGLFANVGWNSNLGQGPRSLPVGTGFSEWNAGLTMVKRQDPLVFTAGFNYIYSVRSHGVRPGGQYLPSVGLLLAVSPETSLQLNQQFIFYNRDSFNGRPIPGSDRTAGILSLGVVSVLGRGRVISVSVGIGETADSPNIIFQVAVPMRLN